MLLCAPLLACVLSACSTVELPTLPGDLPAGWRQIGDTPPNAIQPDLQTWWKVLDDPQLDAMVDQAMTQNLTMAQARSRLRQARLLARRDHTQHLPTLAGNARTLQDISATDNYFQASVDAIWELGLFGAHESAQRNGKARVDAAIAADHGARVSSIAEVVRTYAELRDAVHREALLQRLASLDDQTLALLDLRHRLRLGAPDERLQVVERLAQTHARSSEARETAERASQGLAMLLGRATPDEAWTPAATWPPVPLPGTKIFALRQVPADLLRYRPEIRSAEAQVLKAAAELGIARAELYPRIALGASILYAHNLTRHSRRTSDNIPAIGPVIDIPLFDWGRRRAFADAQKEALDASLMAYRQAVLEGVAETESALSRLQHAQERTRQLQIALDASDRRTQAQVLLVGLGLASELDRLAAQREALQQSIALAAAHTSHTLAFVALYKSLGGAPWPAGVEGSAS
ncbi:MULTISPECIES: TolC family protein [unclassified Variovorax]|uniref:TolC family protein n=1 Tax=unclassified Variovorax TaxID=663243 RepID=UPI003F4862C1